VKQFVKTILKYLFDLIIIDISAALTILLVCNFDMDQCMEHSDVFGWGILILDLTFVVVMWAMGGYRVLWRFAGSTDRIKFTASVVTAHLIYSILHLVLTEGYPVAFYIISTIIAAAGLSIVRVGYKFLYKIKSRDPGERFRVFPNTRVMIVGAGNAGIMLLNDIRRTDARKEYKVCCFIDDDKEKIGRDIRGVKVVGGRDAIEANVKKYDITQIIFAVPSCPAEARAEILEICSRACRVVKTLPSIQEIVNGAVSVTDLSSVSPEDLLGREPVKLNMKNVEDFICGKTVMVTGGGGSIGSELCRQIAGYRPKTLIIFDIYENNAYDIQNELKRSYGGELDLVTLIGSVRDAARVEDVMNEFRPDIVYHAAAHKHVPLMEDSPREAVKNNVFGTLNVVRAADKAGVKRFIMISTDKAVNPTNVMGATKRICEMIIQSYDRHSETEYTAVRFGNVLGSNGSVIPLFKNQIEKGGPVTVTHPDIIRYFMTIPEAVSLVLKSGVEAKGGQIFVLDMGKPVKILTLAENIIRLSGYVPYKDIDIVFTGLRPGEKLYEEMLMSEEGLTKTANKRIYIGHPIMFDEEEFKASLEELRGVAFGEEGDIREMIHKIVPTYKIPD